MDYYTKYKNHVADIQGKRKKIDNTIYSFDIETSSYLILDNHQLPGIEYQNLSKDEQQRCEFRTCMYIWMFSINDKVYYGRTWDEFRKFLDKLENNVPERKIIFIHNLAFEFQYLQGNFNFIDVLARKSHKVMQAKFADYNIELRCTLMMSNCKLSLLPKLFKLPVEKMVGDLDYTLIRHSKTPLSKKELGYCENDCLVVYYYIKSELENYHRVDKIPLTSTGHVRRELKERVLKDYNYRNKVYKAINTDPHIYNLLIQAFMGGYTHANWIYTDEILENIDSWDFTSSYPYILVSHQFPSTEFKKCKIENVSQMSKRFAYIIVVKFNKIKTKYFNSFISQSKCRHIYGGRYDNGRVIQADSLEMTLTDVDFRFILDTHEIESYEIQESYFSKYNYLPTQFIEFVLEKYVNKTQFKNVEGKEVEYTKEKNKFNALYGMSVTNMVRDRVEFDNKSGWTEIPLTNEEIVESLENEKKKCFLSFAYGVWVTAFARSNLLKNVVKLDEHVVYCDTDSIKLTAGYDKTVIDEYNKFVENKIKHVSEILEIDKEKFEPKDVFGEKHLLGVFDHDAHYEKFITQGAKKYAYYKYKSNEKLKDTDNVIEKGKEKSLILEITVAGVPKQGSMAMKSIDEFRDDFVFTHDITNKNLLVYVDNQLPYDLVDYQGTSYQVTDFSGCCLVPTTYILGKAEEYAELISDSSSARAIYQE